MRAKRNKHGDDHTNRYSDCNGKRSYNLLFRWKRGADFICCIRKYLVERREYAIDYGNEPWNLHSNGYLGKLYFQCFSPGDSNR